jgi:hypothetical protein
MPTGPRKARPDDRLSIEPGIQGFPMRNRASEVWCQRTIRDHQQEPQRRIQAQLVSADLAAAAAHSQERSGIAAYWPRCGQNHQP